MHCNKEVGLKEIFANNFLVGAALNKLHIEEDIAADSELIARHFNSITAENVMKWSFINPVNGEYCFYAADKFVEYGLRKNMFIVGHTLIWHEQTPDWVFKDDNGRYVDRETLLGRMRDYIFTIVGRYKGSVNAWDVVNEAISSNGSYRKTKWQEIIGDDFVEKAFEYAHQADPDAELYYNDYNIWKRKERKRVVRLVNDLRKKGIRIDGVGIQGHWDLYVPKISELDKSIRKIAKAGVKVMITELDITVLPMPGNEMQNNYSVLPGEYNPYQDKLPDLIEHKLASRYYDMFKLFIKHNDKISRVTFWGVQDKYSWRNYWPINERTDYPLLFDRNCSPKAAYWAVIKTT